MTNEKFFVTGDAILASASSNTNSEIDEKNQSINHKLRKTGPSNEKENNNINDDLTFGNRIGNR